jgi:hypothetical protein
MTTQMKKIVLVILVILLFGLNIHQWGGKKNSRARHRSKRVIVTPPGMEKNDPKQKSALEDYQKILNLLRLTQAQEAIRSHGDPFQKLDSPQVEVGVSADISTLVVSGIIIEKDGPTALINEKILRIGDSIGEYQVEDIKQNEVILKRGMEKFVLRLFKDM